MVVALFRNNHPSENNQENCKIDKNICLKSHRAQKTVEGIAGPKPEKNSKQREVSSCQVSVFPGDGGSPKSRGCKDGLDSHTWEAEAEAEDQTEESLWERLCVF